MFFSLMQISSHDHEFYISVNNRRLSFYDLKFILELLYKKLVSEFILLLKLVKEKYLVSIKEKCLK